MYNENGRGQKYTKGAQKVKRKSCFLALTFFFSVIRFFPGREECERRIQKGEKDTNNNSSSIRSESHQRFTQGNKMMQGRNKKEGFWFQCLLHRIIWDPCHSPLFVSLLMYWFQQPLSRPLFGHLFQYTASYFSWEKAFRDERVIQKSRMRKSRRKREKSKKHVKSSKTMDPEVDTSWNSTAWPLTMSFTNFGKNRSMAQKWPWSPGHCPRVTIRTLTTMSGGQFRYMVVIMATGSINF